MQTKIFFLKPRLGSLELERQLKNISLACKVMGLSQSTFDRCKELYENGGEEALLHEITKKKPSPNRVPESIERAVIDIATEFPEYGKDKVVNELKKRGIKISSTGVGFVWQRNGLKTYEKRIKALKAKAAKDGLTIEERAALKRIKKQRKAKDKIDRAVISMATEFPEYGLNKAANELKKRGIKISPMGVKYIWQKNDLEIYEKRIKALEVKAAKEGAVLTVEQCTALERAKERREANGEIDTEHPGYLGSQDTYYVGNIEGIGEIYQQTFIDTYSLVAFVKLYTEKTTVTAVHLLNDIVIPFFDEQEVPLLRILTDRGREYYGKLENHWYQLYLGIKEIDHLKTKGNSTQINGICKRFHRTMQDECYDIIFREKSYNSLEDLQMDVDDWVRSYNEVRPNPDRHCYGKTPMQTFCDSKHRAFEKNDKTLIDEF